MKQDIWMRRMVYGALALKTLVAVGGMVALAMYRIEIPPALAGLAGIVGGAVAVMSGNMVPDHPTKAD